MSIPMDAMCFQCHLRRNLDTARRHGDEAKATAFAKELMQLYLRMPEGSSSPELGPWVNDLFLKYYGLEADRMRKEKEDSNAFVLQRLGRIQALVDSAPDPLYGALQCAVLGNYLDFAALQGKVSFEELDSMLLEALQMDLDKSTYRQFCQDLEQGKNVLILTDNAGEIGFDRIFAQ